MRRLPRIQLAVLEVLAERGRIHAYEIKRILKGDVPHASVYAALSAVQAKGYASAEWEIPEDGGSEGGGPPRKYFELTALGRAALSHEHALARAEARPARRPAGGRLVGGSRG
jgi:DNA-binding PadR family transcriptional regulator